VNVFFARYEASSREVAWMRTIGAGFDANAGPVAAGMDASGAPIAAGSNNNASGDIVGYLTGDSASGGKAGRARSRVRSTTPAWRSSTSSP
jgi:hypothetical protein